MPTPQTGSRLGVFEESKENSVTTVESALQSVVRDQVRNGWGQKASGSFGHYRTLDSTPGKLGNRGGFGTQK